MRSCKYVKYDFKTYTYVDVYLSNIKLWINNCFFLDIKFLVFKIFKYKTVRKKNTN